MHNVQPRKLFTEFHNILLHTHPLFQSYLSRSGTLSTGLSISHPCRLHILQNLRDYLFNREAGVDWLTPLTRAHQHQRPLRKGRIDKRRHARQRQTKIDVVQKQKGRERPQLVEHKQKRPHPQKLSARSRRMKQRSG